MIEAGMSRISFNLLWLLVTTFQVQAQATNPYELRLACDSASFPPTISADELVRRFGAQNVTSGSIYLGEGQSELGTILFAGNSEKRLEILWQDTAGKRFPSFIRVQGTGGSLWTTAEGITITTRLRTLERLNGKPFRLAGFGFDGSGSVMSWSEGKLARSGGAACEFRAGLMDVGRDATDRKLSGQVMGDREFSSAHPAMQTLDPRVDRLYLRFKPMPPHTF
jgi:hypothetical protein